MATAAPDTPAGPTPTRDRWKHIVPWAIVALVVAIIVLVTANGNGYEADAAVQVTDNAAIQADSAVLDAKVSGYVRQVAFSDFQSVHAGDLLVQLDDRELRAAVLHAEAALARANAVLANLDNELAVGRASIAQARAASETNASKLRLAVQDDRRFAALADSGAVTGQEADSAQANVDAVRATQQGSLATVELQNRQLDVLRGQRAQRQADVLAAQAALETTRITLSYARIVAPADGIVGQRVVQTGSLLSPGTAVVTFVPRVPPYVVANYKETQLSRVRPGQAVTVEVDGLPGRVLNARVSRLAPASGATFSTVPADNATGNFTKVVQRIPVRIDFLKDQPAAASLRPGMSVTTRIDTRSPA